MRVVACSCVASEPGAPIFSGDEQAVVMGRVMNGDGSGIYPFAVERWFKGGVAAIVQLASDSQRLPDGSFMTSSCGVKLTPGAHLILTAWLSDGVYAPSACGLLADVDSPEGQRLVSAAVAAFAQGEIPGGPSSEPAPGFSFDPALIAILIVIGLVVAVMFGAVALLVRRRRRA